ncbi:MAG: hypothetical protein WCG80_08070 [Spirochaetales bacterium]
MKRRLLTVLLLAGSAALFAQNGPDPFGGGGGGGNGGGGFGPGGPGAGGFGGPQVTWKAGVSVLQEYKALTGVITLGANNAATLKVGSVVYTLTLFPNQVQQLGVKTGDKVAFEGVLTTVKGQDVKPSYRPLTATIGGKVITLQAFARRGGDD